MAVTSSCVCTAVAPLLFVCVLREILKRLQNYGMKKSCALNAELTMQREFVDMETQKGGVFNFGVLRIFFVTRGCLSIPAFQPIGATNSLDDDEEKQEALDYEGLEWELLPDFVDKVKQFLGLFGAGGVKNVSLPPKEKGGGDDFHKEGGIVSVAWY